MPTKTYLWSVAALAGALCLPALAQTQTSTPTSTQRSLYLQVGSARHAAQAATLGLTWPLGWSRAWGRGQLTAHGDAYVGGLSARPYQEGQSATRRSLWAVGIGAGLRWRGQQGQSPWFVEGGTSLTLHSRHYHSHDQAFSTRYNFASHLGLGRNFGAQGQHALSLRWQHISNAGIKKPNPGEDFLLLRYARRF